MSQGIAEVLTFAIGVAISPDPTIAVILMLFSQRARVNRPLFLLGWVVALAIVVAVVYVFADQSGASTSSTASDSISSGKIVFGVLVCSPSGNGGTAPRQAPRQRCPSGWPASIRSGPERRSGSERCSPE